MQIEYMTLSKNTFQPVVVPMFAETQKGNKMVDKPQESKGLQEISLFDVKELYDLAYSKPTDSDEFKSIMADAVKMDMAYRRQLQENSKYSGPFGTYGQQQSDNTKTSKAGEAA